MKRIIGIILFSIVGAASNGLLAQEETTLGWREAIEKALKANPSMQAAIANLEASKKNINIAAAGYIPNLGVTASYSQSKAATFSETMGVLPSETDLVGATVNQMVYNEKVLAGHKIQKHMYASQEQQLVENKNNIISLVGQAYIGLLMNQEILLVQEENLLLTMRNLKASEDRFELGAANQQEVLRWKTQAFAAEQSVASQKANVIMSRNALNQLLNQPSEQDDELEPLTMDVNGFIFSSDAVVGAIEDETVSRLIRDFFVNIGIQNSPTLSSIQHQVDAQERQFKSTKRWAIPIFGLSAGAAAKWHTAGDGADAGDGDGFWKYGLSMTWPLYDGGSSIAKAHQAHHQLESLKYQYENAKTSTEQNIRSVVAMVLRDYENIDFSAKQAEVATMNYELVYDTYLLGESQLIDLIDAQEQKLAADISSRVSVYTFYTDLLMAEQAINYFPFMKDPDQNQQLIFNLQNTLNP